MGRRPYRVLSADDSAVTLAVRDETTAGDLLAAAGVSKAARSHAFGEARVSVEGRPVGPGDPLASGDVVSLALEVAEPEWPEAEPATVVFNDPHGILLAVDKPCGLLVHGDGTGAQTLTDRVQATLANDGRIRSAQAVQRIDVDTSGLVLFSLAPEFQAALDGQVADGSMTKTYLAVVAGDLRRPLEVEKPLGRDRHDSRRMHVGSGRPAKTTFSPLASTRLTNGRMATLAEVSIATGRRHQIRAHGAWAGYPVLGDTLYGAPRHPDGLMLHAWRETLVHPLTWERLHLEAPAPERIRTLFPDAEL